MEGTHASSIKGKLVDFGKQSEAYTKHRPGLPNSFYQRFDVQIKQNLKNIQSLNVLDLGTGPGVVALELAKRYPSMKITGVDISQNQIKYANIKKKSLNLKNEKLINFFVGSAENIPINESNSVDIIICAQCWVWFNRKKVWPEIHRILKHNGLLFIVHYCYLPKISIVAGKTEELILKYNPKWLHHSFNGIYPSQINEVTLQGKLSLLNVFSYDYDQIFNKESWIGRIRTCNGVGSGILTNEQITKFNKDLKIVLNELVGNKENFNVLHRLWCVVGKKCKISRL